MNKDVVPVRYIYTYIYNHKKRKISVTFLFFVVLVGVLIIKMGALVILSATKHVGL